MRVLQEYIILIHNVIEISTWSLYFCLCLTWYIFLLCMMYMDFYSLPMLVGRESILNIFSIILNIFQQLVSLKSWFYCLVNIYAWSEGELTEYFFIINDFIEYLSYIKLILVSIENTLPYEVDSYWISYKKLILMLNWISLWRLMILIEYPYNSWLSHLLSIIYVLIMLLLILIQFFGFMPSVLFAYDKKEEKLKNRDRFFQSYVLSLSC